MHELVQRFVDRYHAWRAERGAERLGAGGSLDTVPLSETERTARRLSQTESFAGMVVRYLGVYLCGIIVVAGVGRIIGIVIPAARSPLFFLAAVVVCFWTFASVSLFTREIKLKKELRERNTNHLTKRCS